MDRIQKIESQRLVEQQRLDNLKDAGERNRLGQFATPTALARDIAKYTRNLWQERSVPVRFLDPAIGTGSFYSALREVFPSGFVERATGFEIDNGFAEAASQLWASEGLEITVSDFTIESPRDDDDRFNLVLTNPPYVRHHHLTVSQKKQLKTYVYRELGLEISGLAGFYCYFMLLAHKWLAENGIGIWLIPSEFMTVNYGDVLKRYLMHHVKLLQIHRFCPSDVQFSDALVSSAIVVFQKTKDRSQSAIFSFGGHITKPENVQHVPLTKLAETRKWTQFPGDDCSTDDDWTLGDLFFIKRGIATGANNFFILPRSDAKALNIPERFQKPILPSPRYLSETVIEAEADGYPAIENQLVLIDCDLSEEEIQRSNTRFWTYLEKEKEKGIHELYLPSRRSPWYSQEKRSPSSFLCTYMGRVRKSRKPFRFFWNQSRAIAANVYLLLYPKGPLKLALEEDPTVAADVFSVLQKITSDMFLDESRVYGGGLYKLEPKELARIPATSLLSVVKQIKTQRQMSLFV